MYIIYRGWFHKHDNKNSKGEKFAFMALTLFLNPVQFFSIYLNVSQSIPYEYEENYISKKGKRLC